jgi:hypothetical protein
LAKDPNSPDNAAGRIQQITCQSGANMIVLGPSAGTNGMSASDWCGRFEGSYNPNGNYSEARMRVCRKYLQKSESER